MTLETLKECLAPEGFIAILAQNGVEALELWRKRKPDLCCLDIMMPGLDGYEVCRRIRAENPRIPILFLSAKSEEMDVVAGLQLGADDFVRKPFGKHELLARLYAALRRVKPAATATPKFRMQDLSVFPGELRAERQGVSIDLSPRELSMLQLLKEKVGAVVDRDAFLDRCWGLEYFPESRTLDQHIAKLRKKIEPDPENPSLIETVRGIGYRFRPS